MKGVNLSTIEARLSRWLLRARDLSGSDTLDFTQEFLAELLGAQRTSVTLSAQTLKQAGLIAYKRGKIRILDVNRLREVVCECYRAVNDQYAEIAAPSGHWAGSQPNKKPLIGAEIARPP